jgi:hypothetical protein
MWQVPAATADPIGPGEYKTYLDGWDVMGSPNTETAGQLFRRHLNAYFKSLAGWLPMDAVADGRTGGTPLPPSSRLFALYPHDSASATGLRAIFVPASDGTTYWIGKRSQFPGNASMANGVEVRRVQTPTETRGGVELLDTDPPFGGFFLEHSLRSGLNFEDVANGITIRGGIERVDADGNEFQFVTVTIR